MSENTLTGGTLWSQSMFDSLFVALRREVSDARLANLLGDLQRKGYGVDAVSVRVMKALGPEAAVRVRRLGTLAPSAPSAPRARYRMTRMRRLRIWVRDARDSVQDACERLRAALTRH